MLSRPKSRILEEIKRNRTAKMIPNTMPPIKLKSSDVVASRREKNPVTAAAIAN